MSFSKLDFFANEPNDLFGSPREWIPLRKTETKQSRYLQYLIQTAPPGHDYRPRHFQQIANLVDRLVSGKSDRVRIHIPPGHAKTQTVTWRLPVYLWTHVDPQAKILITCHSQEYARELGWSIRELALEAGIPIRDDTRAKDNFRTEEGGFLRACGVGATPTGRRFNWIIGDDPIKDRKQIESKATRDAMDQWFTQGILSRLVPGGRVGLIFTRWHEDDLAGRIDERAKNGGDCYDVLKLPAINEGGEALWPEVYPLPILERIRTNMMGDTGLRGWEALYQQNPTPPEGDLFKVDRVVIHDSLPAMAFRVRAWDDAASTNGDYTAGVLLGVDFTGKIWILDVVRVRMTPGERDMLILATANQDGLEVPIVLPKNPGSAGVAQVADWAQKLGRFTLHFESPTGSKEVRAGPVASQMEIGQMAACRAPWNGDLFDELRAFPRGKHDDQVDALSDAYKVLALRRTQVVGSAGFAQAPRNSLSKLS